jgi:hypothetical protein
MSTQPISNSILQELQGFQHHRAAADPRGQATSVRLLGPPTEAPHGEASSPAFVVTIQASQGQQIDQKDTFWHQRKEALDQLGTALQSGDTAAVQQAYDALVALGKDGPLRNGGTFYRADRAQDFAAIGQALQSGDLAGAQQAFAALENTFGHHGPALLGPPTPAPVQLPPGPPTPAPVPSSTGGGPSGPPEIIINVGGTPSTSGAAGEIVINVPQASSTPEEVQINFGGNNGSAGQVTIDVSQQSGKENVAINLNSGSANYQLVLNLLQSDSNSSAHSGSVSLQA